jgi:hypothetical protein
VHFSVMASDAGRMPVTVSLVTTLKAVALHCKLQALALSRLASAVAEQCTAGAHGSACTAEHVVAEGMLLHRLADVSSPIAGV